MLRLIGAEMFKLRKRWMPYVLLLLLLTIILIPLFVNSIIADINAGSLVLSDAMRNIFNSVHGLGIFLVIILTASVIGTEYGWGTLRQTLAKGTSRNNYLTSKLLAVAIAVAGGVLLVVLVGLIANIISGMLVEGAIEWGGFVSHFFASLGRTLLVLAVYMSLAALFAILMRSFATGMAVTIAWYIGESIIIALLSIGNGWLEEVTKYTISYNANNLLMLNELNMFGDSEPWWQSCVILLAYIAVFITAAYHFFRRQDLTA